MLEQRPYYVESTTVDTDNASIKMLVIMIKCNYSDDVIAEADLPGSNLLYLN
jgi:hypothetical protein